MGWGGGGRKKLKVMVSGDISLDWRLGLHWLEIKVVSLPKVRAGGAKSKEGLEEGEWYPHPS